MSEESQLNKGALGFGLKSLQEQLNYKNKDIK
jgi:hypothetical protein